MPSNNRLPHAATNRLSPGRRIGRLPGAVTALMCGACFFAGAHAQAPAQPTSVSPGAPAPSQVPVSPAPGPAATSTAPGTSAVPGVAPGADPAGRATGPGTSPAPAQSTSPGTPVATNPSRSTAPAASATAPGTGPAPVGAATSAGTPVPPQIPRGTLDAGPQAIVDPGNPPAPPDGTLRRPVDTGGAPGRGTPGTSPVPGSRIEPADAPGNAPMNTPATAPNDR